jgi:hypothetical protein
MPTDTNAPYTDIQAMPEITEQDKTPEQLEAEQAQKELFDYELAKPFLKELVDQFESERTATKLNRERRQIDVNIEQLRSEGKLAQDEPFIPIRVIDNNISKEKPAYIAYLQQSRRLVIFHDSVEPTKKHEKLESAFTRGMSYNGWLTPHFKVVDGSQLHGWDWAEAVFDETKPLHAAIEHVGHECLILPRDTQDIQACARIMREFKLTRTQLKGFVRKFGFSKERVDELFNSNDKSGNQTSPADAVKRDRSFTVYRVYCKYEGVVWVKWYAPGCNGWLKDPEKLYLGVDVKQQVEIPTPRQYPALQAMQEGVPIPPDATVDENGIASWNEMTVEEQWVPVEETEYPFSIYIYDETEEKEIVLHKGRAFKDKFTQEGLTAGWSSFMRGHLRASMQIATPTDAVMNPSSLQSQEIKDRAIMKTPMKWMEMKYPEPSMLGALEGLDMKNAQQTNQNTYGLQQKDRVTAKQISTAEKDQNLVTGVQVSNFAQYVRDIYTRVWRIVKSQAEQDLIQLVGEFEVAVDPATGMQVMTFVNDKQVLQIPFDIRPAGDVDYVQRNELIQHMMEFWPVVQNTPIAGAFLGKLLKLQFAEDGELWAQMLVEGNQPLQLLAQFVEILTAAMANPQEIMAMGPEEMSKLQMLLQTAQQVIAQQAGANNPPQPAKSGSPQAAPEQPNKQNEQPVTQ